MDSLKKGTIFKNLWASHETYFVYQGTIKGKGHNADKAYGYGITYIDIDGKWYGSKTSYLPTDLKNDREHYPIVGYIDLASHVKEAILNAIQKEVLE